MSINVVVLPYRDRYFLESFGNAVRDLHIIQALGRSPRISNVAVFNRPVTIHERALRMKKLALGAKPHPDFPGVTWVDTTDLSLFSPLRKRRWLADAYSPWHHKISSLRKVGHLNILLDFTPLAKIDYRKLPFDLFWYDAIDNFTKHNRFSSAERQLVGEKYSEIAGRAHLVSGVSEGAVSAVSGDAPRKLVLTNGLPADSDRVIEPCDANAYDFGFIGFVTDKFDIKLIKLLSSIGKTVGVFGHVYDKRTELELRRIRGVHMHGAFTHVQLPAIMRRFKVGLIPYLPGKLHDESPLKLYQYLNMGKPVLSSVNYEIQSPYVHVYKDLSTTEVTAVVDLLIHASSDWGLRNQMQQAIDGSARWETKIEMLLDHLLARACQRPDS